MKKISSTITMLFFGCCCFAQTKDSSYSENKVNGVWTKNGIDIVTYNANCDIDNDVFQAWDEASQSYINQTQNIYLYDNLGNVTSIITQGWDNANSAWVNTGRGLYKYSDDRLHFVNIVQSWDGGSSSWINNYRILVDYNEDGTSKGSEFDFYFDNAWARQARTSNEYDALKRITKFVYQSYTNNTWVNSSKSDFDYGKGGISYGYYWDVFSNSWIKAQRTFNDYLTNTALPQKQLFQSYTGIDWLNQSRYETEFNANNQVLHSQGESWDPFANAWLNLYRQSQEYYADGSQKFYEFETWDPFTSTWSYGFRARYSEEECGAKVQYTKPSELSADKQSKAPLASTNSVHPVLNLQMSTGKRLVYDLTYTAGGKQYSMQIIRDLSKKQSVAAAKTADNTMAAKNSSISISPNPARSFFTLNMSGYKAAGTSVLTLTDVSGKKVLQQNVQAGSIQKIDVSHLQKGLYIVNINSGKTVITQKLLVQ